VRVEGVCVHKAVDRGRLCREYDANISDCLPSAYEMRPESVG